MAPSRPGSTTKKRVASRKIKEEVSSEDEEDVIYDDESSGEEADAVAGPSNKEGEAFDLQAALDEMITSEQTPKRKRPPAKEVDVAVISPLHYQHNNTNTYMPYIPGRWTPQNTYRLPQDVVLDVIRRNGTEGLGRAEIGHVVGMDATIKTGGRRVTNMIASCTTQYPDHIGQFQKMDGKVRTIRYFWKESDQPEKFQQLFDEFEQLAGVPCPYKIGEVVKFPDQKLNTLRISDITLKRLNRLLKKVSEDRVVVTLNRLIKHITEEETAAGYKYQIDKKSVMKCLIALRSKGLIRLWDTTVRSDAVDYQYHLQIQVIAHRDVPAKDDQEVEKAIQNILDQFHREGRVFPHGQHRVLKKKMENESENGHFLENLLEIDENVDVARSVTDRYQFHRLQTARNIYISKPEAEENENEEDNEMNMDDTVMTNPSDETMEEIHPDEDPNVSMMKLFAKAEKIPLKRSSMFYFGRDSLGYQSKAIRLHILHEYAYHFVHGHPVDAKPTVFQLFSPTLDFEKWPVYDETTAHVYFDEVSPIRFMPPQPVYEGAERGWFMIQDLLAAMPLSVLALINYIPKKIDMKQIHPYLSDPLKRHLPVGCLPPEIRDPLLTERKPAKQIEHSLLLLSAMGLVAFGPNPATRRFPTSSTSMCYISKKAMLYDTSTSQKGYSCVTPPITQYRAYTYDFDTKDDLVLYWHHLRAIVQSTPLSFRLDEGKDKGEGLRHKLYAHGSFDKRMVERDYTDTTEHIEPLEPHEGVAGFDSALFLHLKRHWDLFTTPHMIVSWFVGKFRKDAENSRSIIERRVDLLQKDWNSFVRLNLSDSVLMKSKTLRVEFPAPKVATNVGLKKVKQETNSKKIKPKKRKLDNVDLISSTYRMNVRCRFTSKERDQLIMIRAVGFFLNPVYRFWLDPTVLRDLMHEFVPESQSKTVQSLMACGVRELVRSNRLAYLQRIVRNLSTFPEMKRLRYELCSNPPSTELAKTTFFKNAFRKAMTLLFADNDRIPHTKTSDKVFKNYLNQGNVSVTKETTIANALPYRSQQAKDCEHIQHCIATNILLSVLIHSNDGQFSEGVLDQVPPTILQNVLQALRTDGLVSRSRADTTLDVANKNQANLSYYFRHFFAHRFHSDLIDGTGEIMEQIDEEPTLAKIELNGDSPAVVIAAATTYAIKDYNLSTDVDQDILEAFTKSDPEQTIKKIRYLESADLHFEKIHVLVDRTGVSDDMNGVQLTTLIQFLDTSKPEIDPERKVEFEDWMLELSAEDRDMARNIMSIVKYTKAGGASYAEIRNGLGSDDPMEMLKKMSDDQQIVECGVDQRRWASIEYETMWTVKLAGKKWRPRPWTLPYGGICLSTVRWMAESVLLAVVGKLGIQLKDLTTTYEFAAQPIVINELVEMLEKAECLKRETRQYRETRLTSPFGGPTETIDVVFLLPAVDAIEKFARIFHGIHLLPSMVSKQI